MLYEQFGQMWPAPGFWLSFRVNQEVCTCFLAKYPFQKCWGKACDPVIMSGQTLLHTCQFKGQRGNPGFGLHRCWKNLWCLAWSGRVGVLHSPPEYRSKLCLALLDEVILNLTSSGILYLMGAFSSLYCVERQNNWIEFCPQDPFLWQLLHPSGSGPPNELCTVFRCHLSFHRILKITAFLLSFCLPAFLLCPFSFFQ